MSLYPKHSPVCFSVLYEANRIPIKNRTRRLEQSSKGLLCECGANHRQLPRPEGFNKKYIIELSKKGNKKMELNEKEYFNFVDKKLKTLILEIKAQINSQLESLGNLETLRYFNFLKHNYEDIYKINDDIEFGNMTTIKNNYDV